MKKLIVITGNLGSGKSLAAQILCRGFPCIDADSLVALALKRKKEELKKIIPSGFAGNVVLKKKIANIIFSNPAIRLRWEKSIHDFVFVELKKWLQNKRGVCLFVAPLFFEAKGFRQRLKSLRIPVVVVLIASRRDRCLKVAKEKWGAGGAERLKLQIKPEVASLKSDIVLGNFGALATFKKNVMILEDILDVL